MRWLKDFDSDAGLLGVVVVVALCFAAFLYAILRWGAGCVVTSLRRDDAFALGLVWGIAVGILIGGLVL